MKVWLFAVLLSALIMMTVFHDCIADGREEDPLKKRIARRHADPADKPEDKERTTPPNANRFCCCDGNNCGCNRNFVNNRASQRMADVADGLRDLAIHGCVKAFNVASPASVLFYTGEEERNYASVCSDDDEDWKDEFLIDVSDFSDGETQTAQQHVLNKDIENIKANDTFTRLASEPRLGPARHSDIGLTAATSEPMFGADQTEDSETHGAGTDSTVRFAADTKTDEGPGTSKPLDITTRRATRSEGVVKAGERPQGRGRILEIGRSIANVLIRPFRRQGRRRGEQPTTDKSQLTTSKKAAPKTEDTAKMEESRLPAEEIITRQFRSKNTKPRRHGIDQQTAEAVETTL